MAIGVPPVGKARQHCLDVVGARLSSEVPTHGKNSPQEYEKKPPNLNIATFKKGTSAATRKMAMRTIQEMQEQKDETHKSEKEEEFYDSRRQFSAYASLARHQYICERFAAE